MGLSTLKSKDVFIVNPNTNNIVLKLIRYVHRKIKAGLFFELWIKQSFPKLEDPFTIIVFDSQFWIYAIPLIRMNFPISKIIFYFWNPIENATTVDLIKPFVDKLVTFDKLDSINYEIIHLDQFFWKIQIPKKNISNDFIFVGQAKNRLKSLENLYTSIKNENLKSYFHVIRNNRFQKSNVINLTSKYLNYSDYLNMLIQAKCIIDVNQTGQEGLTLRPMESIFFGKKLVSNNNSLLRYDFYHPSFIYILGKDTRKLKDFLNEDSKFPSSHVISEYEISSWLYKILQL